MKNRADNQLSVFSLAMELGYMIAIPIVLFALGGRFLDKKMDSSPWFLLAGICLSIVLTTYLVYRKTMTIINEQ
jgi:F0F1-type ATP synthase assembly protein I